MSYSLYKVKEDVDIGKRFLVVASALLIAIIICSRAAYEFVTWVNNVENPRVFGVPIANISTLSASIILLITILKTLAISIRDYFNYIKDGKSFDYYKESISILASIFMVFLSYYAYKEIPSDEESQVISWDALYLYEPEPKAEELAIFPLLFDNASLDYKGNINAGIVIDEDKEALILKLVSALAPCASPGYHLPVVLEIDGYASSAEFMISDTVHPDSDAKNEETAYLRAHNTYEAITDAINVAASGRNFVIVEPDRQHYTADRVPPFIDRKDFGSKEQELFTRSAFIRLKSAGKCQRWVTDRDLCTKAISLTCCRRLKAPTVGKNGLNRSFIQTFARNHKNLR